MKKIILIRNAFAYDFGGGERMPINTAKELNSLGYKTLVVSKNPTLLRVANDRKLATKQGLWWSKQDWSGKNTILFPIYVFWQLTLSTWYTIVFLNEKPDIIHVQSKDDFIAATIAGKILGKKVIWSDHADLKYVYQNLNIWYKNPVGKLVKYCSKFASTIIITSENDYKLVQASYGANLPTKYKVIYNGVSDILPKLSTIKEKNITFYSTSRLVSAKGIRELIEAFNLLSKTHNSQLWIMGEGPEETKFKKLAAGNSKIKFLGFPEDYLEIASKAHVFVHPSYMEGFSVSIVEATMLGMPLIACKVGGNPEIINKENGILIKEKDVNSLHLAMKKLIQDKALRESMALNSRKEYEKRFNLRNVIKEKYIEEYEKN